MSQRAAEKAETHERILTVAGRLIRHAGLSSATVPGVMRDAGLTVGGFYAHFRSKQAMDAEVLRRALGEMRESWFKGLAGSDQATWYIRAVKRYLSAAHRDSPSDGCPLPASLAEIAHADKGTRDAFTEGLLLALAEFAEHAPPAAGVTARERALATLALCIGGLTVARALRDSPLSDELLRACVKWALPELPQRSR